ncbi:hypothetical protein ACIA5D_10990 [Actinoplanes sp. NPDC051513]|uniref:hypothetical protein n=1 Tax=Actinoplanes sp. NPDC051513 TaxID=3363908 RepID=UPI0037935DE8
MPDRVLLDAADAYPEVTKVRDALAGRDWSAARAVLDAASPAGRSMLIDFAAEGDDLEDFLQYVVATDPDDTAAVAMLGMHLIKIGWNIRSGARAQYVSSEQFESFHDWLRRAEAVLLDGVARNPADPALWFARLTSARGLELGLAETRRRYQKLAAIDPHHLPGQSQYLQRLCPKWSGSWETLHPWCREAMLAAPPGAVQGVLVADAHIEHWLDLDDGADARYLESPPVRAEVYEAAQRSIFHAEFRRNYGWVQAASTFAMLFVLFDDAKTAAAAFGLLGDLGTEHPWHYFGAGEVSDRIRRNRKWALENGGSR